MSCNIVNALQARRNRKGEQLHLAKGIAVAAAIMLAAIPIPLVHFVAIPISPFVAGFVGGGIAKADESKIIWFGLILAGLMSIPSAVIVLAWVVMNTDTLLGAPSGFWLVIGIALVPYTWFGATVGALLSYLSRRRSDGG